MSKYPNSGTEGCLEQSIYLPKKRWNYLTNYLKDGRLEISNKRAERSMKPFVIDRKNFLFAISRKEQLVVRLCSG